MNFAQSVSKTTFSLAVSVTLLSSAALAQTTVTVTSAVSAAQANNTDVKTAQANLAKAQTTNIATQSDPSSLVAAKLAAQNAYTLAQAQLRAAKLSTLQSTITAYMALLEAQQNVQVQTLQVQTDQKNVQVAQVKQGVGNATTLDVQNAQNTASSSQQALSDASAQVNLASAKLTTLTGLGTGLRASGPASTPAKLSVTLTGLQSGLSALSSLVGASGDLSTAQLNVKLANNDFTPALTLQTAKTALANAQRSLDSAQKTAQQTLASAYQSAQNAYQLLQVALSREAAAQKTYSQAAVSFKSGTISSVDLQAAQLTLKKAQYTRLQAQDNALEALAALSVAAGQNLTGIGGNL